MADQFGNETGAESTEVNIYTLPADADFKAVLAECEAEMTKAGWQADQKLTQSDDKGSVAAWADNDNMSWSPWSRRPPTRTTRPYRSTSPC
jgi:hypothetical protein